MITEYKYRFTVYRLPFTVSVTLNISMFMEVVFFSEILILAVTLQLVSKSSLTLKDSEPLMRTGHIFLEIVSVLLLGGGKKRMH